MRTPKVPVQRQSKGMKATLSLADELRAIRGGPANKVMGPRRVPDPAETERPWQADIDRVQQTLQQVLQAISSLSGVELPGTDADPQSPGGFFTRTDFRTLKDRIRNELEAFSVTTTAEISKEAEEQTRAALDAIRTEVSGRIQELVGEYREKLQGQFEPEQIGIDLSKQARDRVVELVETRTDEFARWVWLMCKGTGTPIPAQIEKLLEPYVEEASAKLEGEIRQGFQDQLIQQEQYVQEKLQGTVRSLAGQVSTLEQAAQQICERNANAVTNSSVERLNAVAEEAAKGFASRIGDEAEGSAGRFQTRLEEILTASQEGLRQESERKAADFRQKLEGVADEVANNKMSEISGRIEQTAAAAIESSVQHLQQQTHDAVEHSKEEMKGFLAVQMEEVQGQVKELGQSAHESLSQDAVRVAESLKGLEEELSGIREHHLAASQEQLSGMIQTTMESLTARLKQITDAQMEEIGRLARESQEKAAAQYQLQLQAATEGQYNEMAMRLQKEVGEAGAKVAAEIKADSESLMQGLSDKANASASVLREAGLQASARIESTLQNSLEACKQQFAQMSESGFEEHHKVIANSIAEIHSRLMQAAEALVRGNS